MIQIGRARNRVGFVTVRFPFVVGPIAPFQDIDAITNWNRFNEPVLVDNFIPSQQIGGVIEIVNISIRHLILCLTRTSVEKYQAAYVFADTNAVNDSCQTIATLTLIS